MRRLRDEPHLDPAAARAAQLLRAIPSITPSTRRRSQSRTAIEAARARPSGTLELRLAIVALVVLGGAALAGATIGHRWVASHRAPASALSVLSPPAREVSAPSSPRGESIGQTPPAAAARASDQVALAASEPRPRAPHRLAIATPRVVAPSPESGAAPAHAMQPPSPPAIEIPIGEGAELLVEALQAIRRGRDGVGGAARIDQYLTHYPGGALIEESLAIGMEADAIGAHDGRRLYAAEYLRRFPAGRFAPTARAALGPVSP